MQHAFCQGQQPQHPPPPRLPPGQAGPPSPLTSPWLGGTCQRRPHQLIIEQQSQDRSETAGSLLQCLSLRGDGELSGERGIRDLKAWVLVQGSNAMQRRAKGREAERMRRKPILFQCKTIHFKYPFYYIICIVILIIDLVGSSNEAGEYKVSNKVNCCL